MTEDYTDSDQGQWEREREEREQYEQETRVESWARDVASHLAFSIHDVAFGALDAMSELNGEQAGRIAKLVQDVVEREIQQILISHGK
jgi:hypothetical protein